MMASQKTWYMVPVRGGSQSVPRKNARILGGKPLMAHVLETIKKVDSAKQIFVVTDNDELSAIAQSLGVQTFKIPPQTGKETLDEKAIELLPELEKHGAKPNDIFLTVQATCPFLNEDTVRKAKTLFKDGAGSVITAIDDRHLTWTEDEDGNPVPEYKERVNRQWLPPRYRESGAIIGARIKDIKQHKTRIVDPIGLLPITKEEGLDIDTFSDWTVAEYLTTKCKILIRADAGKLRGMGHVYRALAVAQELARYKPVLVSRHDKDMALGYEFLKDQAFSVIPVKSDKDFLKLAKTEKADLIIVDQLDTKKSYIESLKKTGAKLVTFEDMGEGAKHADLLISDLYENPAVPDDRQLHGVDNAILAPGFFLLPPKKTTPQVIENILILFGGSDPSDLTEKSLKALGAYGYKGNVTVVQGLGCKDRAPIILDDYGLQGEVLNNVVNIPFLMHKADMAFSSAGRTITELMHFGIPTLCMCQNEKELTHTHATQAYGVINLGLGTLVDERTLVNNISFLLENYAFRSKMQERALRGRKEQTNRHVVKRMLDIIDLDF